MRFVAAEWSGSSRSFGRTVIRTNQNERVVAERFVAANPVEENSELLVHRFQNREIESSLFSVSPVFDRRPKWTVNIVGPKIDVERTIPRRGGFVDEGHGSFDKSTGDFGTQHPAESIAEAFCFVPDFPGFFLSGPERQGKQFRSHSFKVCQ